MSVSSGVSSPFVWHFEGIVIAISLSVLFRFGSDGLELRCLVSPFY